MSEHGVCQIKSYYQAHFPPKIFFCDISWLTAIVFYSTIAIKAERLSYNYDSTKTMLIDPTDSTCPKTSLFTSLHILFKLPIIVYKVTLQCLPNLSLKIIIQIIWTNASAKGCIISLPKLLSIFLHMLYIFIIYITYIVH